MYCNDYVKINGLITARILKREMGLHRMVTKPLESGPAFFKSLINKTPIM